MHLLCLQNGRVGGGVVQEEDEGMMMGWPLLQGDPEPPPPHLALLHTLFA